MSNSIGPCPTELDTLDSNIGAALALAAAGRPRRRRHMRFPVISRSCIKPERGVGSVFVCEKGISRGSQSSAVSTPSRNGR